MNDKLPIDRYLYNNLKHYAGLTPEHCKERLIEFLGEYRPVEKRTSAQNAALHLDCKMIAEKLNDAGYDMRKLLTTINIPWSTSSVKEYLWKPIQEKMFQKKSTTELDKHVEITKVHEVLMRELGERRGIEWHPFPSNDTE